MENKKYCDSKYSNKSSNDKSFKELNDINNYATNSREMEKISKDVSKEIDKLKKELCLV